MYTRRTTVPATRGKKSVTISIKRNGRQSYWNSFLPVHSHGGHKKEGRERRK
jgi:hypothetical protein